VSLQETQLGVMDVKRRYPTLYVPSDFFFARIRWQESFPPTRPLNIFRSNPFHIIRKGSARNVYNDDLYPPDADFRYSAKVMLLNSVKLEEMVQECCCLDASNYRDKVPLSKVCFGLVGKAID
jgi:hypothetical protein